MAMTALGQFPRPKLLAVLLVTYMVNYADRMTLSVLGESIKRDLALSDAQVGMLGGTAFTILYVLVSFPVGRRSEEHTSELQSLMRISYAVFCLKKKNKQHMQQQN